MTAAGPDIRRATRADAAALAHLKRDTFRETFVEGFGIPYPPDDLRQFEHQAYGIDQITVELADPETATWVVERDGVMLGYAKVGPCHLPHPDADPGQGEIPQLYLRRSAQGAGLGARLLTLTLDHLATTRPGPVWLGVWSGNSRAQAIYARHGFVKVGDYHFAVGSWRDHEFILRRP